ncbi:MAG: hypothetical protein ACK5K7_01365 [Bacilli bacterium]
MKIEYYVNNQYITLEIGKKNLFLKEIGGGKSSFSELFFEGMSAKSSHDFVVNGVNVDKTMFNVIYVDEQFDFDDYLKFKVRGDMFKDFKKNLLEDYEESLNQFLLKLNEEIFENNFSQYYDILNNSLVNGKIILNSGINSIEDVYDKMFGLIFDNEKLSYSSKIEIVIKHMLLFKDKVKANIIIIDDYIIRMNYEVISSILKLIDELDGVYVIFTSSMCLCLNKFDNVFFSGLEKLSLEVLYKKLFLYHQWDKEGDFNVFYDSHISLVEKNDLVKFENLISKYETIFYNIADLNNFCNKAIEIVNLL